MEGKDPIHEPHAFKDIYVAKSRVESRPRHKAV